MSAARFRPRPATLRVIHDAFMQAVMEKLPHMEPEAQPVAATLWGPRPDIRPYPQKGELAGLIARLDERAEYLATAAKRGTLSTVLDVKVDGEVSPQFARIWAAYRKTPGVVDPGQRVQIGETHVMLSWGSGHYKIFREAVIGACADLEGYKGPVHFEEVLLRKGGPFQLEITADGPRASDLSRKVSPWRICLALMHEKGARRGSVYYEDILHRFRCGNAVSFRQETKYGRPVTSAAIAAGKADPAWVKRVAACTQNARNRADRLKSFTAALEARGTAEAEKFCAAPDQIAENQRRELRAAKAEFTQASEALYKAMQAAVYRKDLPARPYTAMPADAIFPRHKAVGNGPRHDYDRAQSTFKYAWERLVAARAANPDPPEDPRLEKLEQVLASAPEKGGQELLALA
jgi:hypothetical protein